MSQLSLRENKAVDQLAQSARADVPNRSGGFKILKPRTSFLTRIFCVRLLKVVNIILKVHDFQLPTKRRPPPLLVRFGSKWCSGTPPGPDLKYFRHSRDDLSDSESGFQESILHGILRTSQIKSPFLKTRSDAKWYFFGLNPERPKLWISHFSELGRYYTQTSYFRDTRPTVMFVTSNDRPNAKALPMPLNPNRVRRFSFRLTWNLFQT